MTDIPGSEKATHRSVLDGEIDRDQTGIVGEIVCHADRGSLEIEAMGEHAVHIGFQHDEVVPSDPGEFVTGPDQVFEEVQQRPLARPLVGDVDVLAGERPVRYDGPNEGRR